jgi:hypothetical protein
MKMTVQIKWTLQISTESKDVFSCTEETYYILNCTTGENPSEVFDLLIGTSLFDLEIKWKSETTTIPVFRHTVHAPNDTIKETSK